MILFDILAEAGPAAPPADPLEAILRMGVPLLIMGVMFYFLLIRPQQKQRKEHENLLKQMKSGDRVLTTGGIYGIVTNVKEKSVMVKIADNVKVEIVKSAVSGVMPKSAEESGEVK